MMLLIISVILFLVFVTTVAYFRWSLLLWSFIPGALLAAATYFGLLSMVSLTILWLIYAMIAVPLNFKPLRRILCPPFHKLSRKRSMQAMSGGKPNYLAVGPILKCFRPCLHQN